MRLVDAQDTAMIGVKMQGKPMIRTCLALIALSVCCGCTAERLPNDEQSRKNDVGTSDESKEQAEESPESTSKLNDQTDIVTRQDLDQWINEIQDSSEWHYEDPSGGDLAGTWVAADGSGHRLVFDKDGSFQEDFNGELAPGLFAISDNGRIVAFSKLNGIANRSHYWLEGAKIIGPRGHDPKSQWVKAAKD